MRHWLIICLAVLSYSSLIAQFSEDFSDGELLIEPQWYGDQEAFRVSASDMLQLDADSMGASYLTTVSRTFAMASWEIRVIMEFNPSANNYCRIYLASDRSDLTGDLQGYFLKIGDSEDDISLYRQSAENVVKIIDGPDDFVNKSSIDLVIRTQRDSLGQWQLQAKDFVASNFAFMGSAIDTTTMVPGFFGILCTYTTTRRDKFFFDDIIVTGPVYQDTTPAQLRSLRTLNDHAVELIFSEPMATGINLLQFMMGGAVLPQNIIVPAPEVVILEFEQPFLNGEVYQLQGRDLADLAGNLFSFEREFAFVVPGELEPYDIVITEIMADPSPQVEQPDKEFLELLNRSDKALDLQQLQLSDLSKSVSLPPYLLLPEEYVVLCSSSTANQFPDPSTRVIGLPGWPSLNNMGDLITLATPDDQIIHAVEYFDSWYRSELKKYGGWSLEMIDVNYPCTGKLNWTASDDPSGGTPGMPNSVRAGNPDLSSPSVVSTLALSPDTIQVIFDQQLQKQSLEGIHLELEPPLAVDQVILPQATRPLLHIILQENLKSGQIYQLHINNLADCNGNFMLVPQDKVQVGLPMAADSGDLVVNEILFNPRPLGVRFVEIYNRSSKAVDLKDWQFGRWQESALVNLTSLTSSHLMIYPGEIRVFTTDPTLLKDQYPLCSSINMEQVGALPSLPDRSGSIILVSKKGTLIDQFLYHQDLHHPLLTDKNGVSLERVSVQKPSNHSGNWVSASEQTGYATPGKPNSQKFPGSGSQSIQVFPKLISPLSRHLPHYTQISFNLDNPGSMAQVSIFNADGKHVTNLATNVLTGTEGSFIWDGTDRHGRRVPMGPYLILLQITDIRGSILRWKDTVVIAPDF